MGFVDDVNILAYSTSTEENCRILESMHEKCIQWASKHGAVFAPQKYELVHLARNPKKFNMRASVHKNHKDISPKADIRILGVQIDTKLRWHAHVREIHTKMTKQTLLCPKSPPRRAVLHLPKLGTLTLRWSDLQCFMGLRFGIRRLSIKDFQSSQLENFQSFRTNAHV